MMSTEKLARHMDTIAQMSRLEACHIWRFAKTGHPYLVTGTILGDTFVKRFKELGGFSPEISKQLGWK